MCQVEHRLNKDEWRELVLSVYESYLFFLVRDLIIFVQFSLIVPKAMKCMTSEIFDEF